MKTRLSSRLSAIAVITIAATSYACNGQSAGATPFTTDSVGYSDSAAVAGSTATVKIAGRYPTGGPEKLVDSTRLWISGFLKGAKELGDGQKMVRDFGTHYLDSLKSDMQSYAADDFTVDSEFEANFRPIFEADGLLTYIFNTYVYAGGAHGMSISNCQSFMESGGEKLNASNIFVKGCEKELSAMVKNALWQQYFKQMADSYSPTLKNMLFVDPDTLPLPSLPPYFMKEGLTFTYQQYEIAPYAFGMPSCVLPYDKVRPLLRPEIAAMLPKRVDQ